MSKGFVKEHIILGFSDTVPCHESEIRGAFQHSFMIKRVFFFSILFSCPCVFKLLILYIVQIALEELPKEEEQLLGMDFPYIHTFPRFSKILKQYEFKFVIF